MYTVEPERQEPVFVFYASTLYSESLSVTEIAVDIINYLREVNNVCQVVLEDNPKNIQDLKEVLICWLNRLAATNPQVKETIRVNSDENIIPLKGPRKSPLKGEILIVHLEQKPNENQSA